MEVKNYSYAAFFRKTIPLFLMMLFVNVGWGQVTVFSENMGTPTSNTAIAANTFQNSTLTFSGTADVRNNTPSAAYTNASGGGNVFITNITDKYFTISGINSANFNSLGLSFGVWKSSGLSSAITSAQFVVEVATNYNVSSNTGTFSALSYATISTGSAWSLVTISGGTIPSSNNLAIRFRQNQTTAQLRIDDVKLTGTTAPSGPTVTTTAATPISASGATLNGAINANGVSTTSSFEYGTTGMYGNTAVASPETVTGASVTSISGAITGLSPNTNYNFRAVGTVSSTATNGANQSFWTLANVPSASTVDNATINTLDVVINPNGNPTTTEYAIQTGTSYVQADGSLGATAVWQTASTWGTKTVMGLNVGTLYSFEVKARNGASTETAFGAAASGTTTTPVGTPTATAATAITATGFTSNWGAVSGATGYELDVYEITPAVNIFEGFELTVFPPTGWATTGWVKSTTAGDINTGNAAAIASSSNGTLTTNAISNPSSLSFYLGRSSNTTAKTLLIEVSTTNQTTGFTTVATLDHNNVPVSSYNQYTIDLSAYENEESVYIRFNKSSSTTSPWRLDDIVIVPLSKSYVTGYPDLAVVGTSKVVTGLTPNTEYFYIVRAKDATSTSVNSNEIAVTTLDDKTTYTAGAWTNGDPTVNLDAIIADNFTSGTNFTAKSLTINAGSVFTVGSGSTVTVANALVNNAGESGLVIKNNGVFLQTATTANTALATVERNSSPLFRMDYTLWSSPVTGQKLRAFSPATLFNRFYSYNTETNVYTQEIVTTQDVSTINFGTGAGYLIRMPNNWIVNSGTPADAVPYEGSFKGTLNNGTVTKPLSLLGAKYNLVGNPYPSPISIATLMSVNTSQIEGTIYMWRKKGSAALPAGSGYVAYNALGQNQLFSGAQNGSTVPSNLTHIQTGQGFFVTAKAGATAVKFNNTMRESAATEFFKTSVPVEMNRLWLTLSDATAPVGHVLVGYTTDATQGVDSNFDAPYFNDSPLALTSIINNNEYSIQGRALPFTPTDVVTLGFKTDVAGSYSIALTNYDGVFDNDQDVFLKDNATNQLHNLKTAAYTFNSVAGVFNQRFELRYQGNLDTNNPSVASSSILIAVKNQQIKINAGSVTMEKVELIDVAGRVIYTVDGINATTATIENLVASNQILIVRISTKENGVVNQKIIF